MVSGIHASISALHGFEKKLNAAADNTANVNTHHFKKQRVLLVEGSHGGVDSRVQRVDAPGFPVETVQEGQRTTTESSNVDLSEETGETVVARRGYQVNLKTLGVQDEMLGSLLDILG